VKYNDDIHTDRQEGLDKCIDKITSLQRVEINCVELCNRACVFCPRSNPSVYPNRNLHMSVNTINNVCNGLKEINYGGRITFSGMGEPLLHRDLFSLLEPIKQKITTLERLQVITNGDKLTKQIIKQLIDCGVDRIEINMYDGPEQIEYFTEMFDDTKYMYLRHHYYGEDVTYGLTLNNRAGAVNMGETPKKYNQSTCYLPFYKMVIDWNGDLLLCAQDWLHESELNININDVTIHDAWLSPQLTKYRDMLLKYKRCTKPCDKCNVIGTIVGEQAFNNFK